MQFGDLNHIMGVELKMLDESLFSCRTCLISKNKTAVTIEHSKVINGTLATVLLDWPKQYPVALTLSGRGILHKNIQLEGQSDENLIFHQGFPAIEHKDFYVQQFHIGENFSIAIARKQIVDELLAKLKLAGLQVYKLSFGALPALHVLVQLNSYGDEVRFDGHFFKLSGDRNFLSYHAQAKVENEFAMKLGQETIAEEMIVAYASAFQLLLHQKLLPIYANVPTLDREFSEFLNNSRIKKRAFFFLVGMLVLLLISFLLFSHYNTENEVLALKVGNQIANVDQTELLKKTSTEKAVLLKQLGWNGGYNYGLILNEIGESLPKQLQLQEVSMNDFKTAEEKLERAPNIKIVGITSNLMAVNNWMFVLKAKNWVKTVKLLKYQEDDEKENYQFNLLITY